MDTKRPNQRRNRTLQATPTLASLLCELRIQRPDLALRWSRSAVLATLTEPLYVMDPATGQEFVAGEWGDKLLALSDSGGQTAHVYSPFLREPVFAGYVREARVGSARPRSTQRSKTPRGRAALRGNP